MKLILREYLSMLKESGELDTLIPDLLLNMEIVPTSKAQVGVRQYGVDVAGVGPDPDDEVTKLFLVTIKQGDFDRNSWDDGTPQAIRPSLNEIIDVYLDGHVDEEHDDLPVKIVVCCGGDMKQNVERNWKGYKKKHATTGKLEFDFWGADKLALLIERHFLDEYLFPESAQKQIRKTIALADQNEDEPRHFYTFVEETLFERDLSPKKTRSGRRQRRRALRLLNLSLNLVYQWCREADNLRPALLCAERTLLCVWDWMRQSNLVECKATHEEFIRLFQTYLNIIGAYGRKLQPHCYVRDGLFRYGSIDTVEYPIRTFEAIGILAEMILAQGELLAMAQDEKINKALAQQVETTAHMLASLIANNPAAYAPCYDSHAIDITLGLLALLSAGFKEEAAEWIEELSSRLVFGYQTARHFPVWSDSYEDVVELHFGEPPPKAELMQLSTLIPILAEWHAVLDLDEAYTSFRKAVTEMFNDTDLQIWYPDEATDDFLYRTNAGFKSGNMLSSIELPETLAELRERVTQLQEERETINKLSCVQEGWPILALIASRHFRMPVIPAYWELMIAEASQATQSAK